MQGAAVFDMCVYVSAAVHVWPFCDDDDGSQPYFETFSITCPQMLLCLNDCVDMYGCCRHLYAY